jgi:succinate dehydrogenase/fumarate reductase-like Fe-S protein
MKYLKAVSEWNKKQREVNTAHVYAVPRKGTREYEQVQAIMKTPEFPAKREAAEKAVRAMKRVKAAKGLKAEIEERIKRRKAPEVKPEIYEDFTEEVEEREEIPVKPARRKNVNPVVECAVCGSTYTKANKAKHFKTARHVRAERQLNRAVDELEQRGMPVAAAALERINDQVDTRQMSQDNRAELELLMELSKRLAASRRDENDDEL